MTIIGIVQARLGSTRLPGKVLALIEGEPMTWHIVRRLRQAQYLDDVVLAVPAHDQALIQLAKDYDISYFAGSETDVIGRIYGAAHAFGADAIVRITGDCPLVDPDIVDKVIREYMAGDWLYVCNARPWTYPDGMSFGLFSFHLLKWLDSTLKTKIDREWFLNYMWENLDADLMHSVTREEDISHLRWTVDYPEDLEFTREVYAELGGDFRTANVLALLERRPELVILDEPRYKRGQINE